MLLNRYDINLPVEQSDRIEATRWALTRLIDRVATAAERIAEVQYGFRKTLVQSSKEVAGLINQFMEDYQEVGV